MRQICLFALLLMMSSGAAAQCCCGEMILKLRIRQPVFTHEIIAASIFDQDDRNLESLLSSNFEDEYLKLVIDTGCGLQQLKVVFQQGREQMVIHFFSVLSDRHFEYMPFPFKPGYYPVFGPGTLDLATPEAPEDRHKYYLESILHQAVPVKDLDLIRIANYSPSHKPNPVLEVKDENAFRRKFVDEHGVSVMIEKWDQNLGNWVKTGAYFLNEETLRTRIEVMDKGLYRVIAITDKPDFFLLGYHAKW